MPRPANPQSWNRYSYVNNSPFRYIDPTGHRLACGVFGEGCEDDEADALRQPGPTILDESKLDKIPGIKTKVSAADVYKNYLELWFQPDGYWWDAFGRDADGFTIYDYLSMVAYNEAAYNTDIAKGISEAGVRWFYERVNEGYKGYTDDIYGILYWWARYSESGARIIKSGKPPELDPSVDDPNEIAKMVIFGKSLQILGIWREGMALNSPYGWANASAWNDINPGASKSFNANSHAIFYTQGGGDTLYFPSGCAVSTWVDKTRSGNCDPVAKWH